MVFQCINIRQVPWEVLKTAAFGLGFQHLPRDLANVNAWKTIFDPYIHISHNVRNRTFGHVRQAKIQISLRINVLTITGFILSLDKILVPKANV